MVLGPPLRCYLASFGFPNTGVALAFVKGGGSDRCLRHLHVPKARHTRGVRGMPPRNILKIDVTFPAFYSILEAFWLIIPDHFLRL